MLTPFHRKIKQINVFLVFLIFLLIIGGGILFFFFKTKKITLKPISIVDFKGEIVSQNPLSYLFKVTLENPNKNFKAKSIAYILVLQDEEGKTTTKKEGSFSLKGGEKKTFSIKIIPQRNKNVKAFLKVTNIVWEKL